MIYTIEQLKERIAPVASKHQLNAVYVFGSYARGEASEEADIDLLVDTDGTSIDDMLGLGGLYDDLGAALEKEIDMLTKSTLQQASTREQKPLLEETIDREKVQIYG